MTHYLEILQPDGSSERYPLRGGQDVIVGRQPRQGIAVPGAAELELEHLRVTARADGCWFSITQGARTPALVGGQHFGGGLLPWGTAVQVGTVWLKAIDGAAAGRPRAIGLPGLLASAALVLVAGWLFMSPAENQLAELGGARPPALFPSAAAACPEAEPAAAGPRAAEAADAARAKSERYPFASQDGIRAAELYALAAACFTAAGKDADAERATRDRAALVARIEEDYRTHRLKLDRAIEYRRTGQALVETRELLSLVAHLEHPYTTWLTNLERRISLKTGSPK
ncbi:MAG TPA: hypothetical protein VNO33_12055 [Kofleriaceae bacterium]|nr:hypothetical protein [Kofleriaceae bacterium]